MSIDESQLKEKLSMDQLVFRHLLLLNTSIGSPDPSKFEAYVRALLIVLPKESRSAIMAREDEFNTEREEWVYQYCCGVPMGTPKHPIYQFEPGDPEYDPDNLIPYSPRRVSKIETDYECLYKFCLESLESLGVTWSTERKMVMAGVVSVGEPPRKYVNNVETYLVEQLAQARKENPELSYDDFLTALKGRSPPPTPSFGGTSK